MMINDLPTDSGCVAAAVKANHDFWSNFSKCHGHQFKVDAATNYLSPGSTVGEEM